MQHALEDLSTIGSVSVSRSDVAESTWHGFEYALEFRPWESSDMEHYLNYGDMPTIAVRNSVS